MTTNGRPVRLLRGYGWWIILVTVLITAGAYALSRVETVDHRSTATAVAGARLRAGFTPGPADAATEATIARSATVLQAAADELRMTADDLADGLTVAPVEGGGTAITIGWTGREAATARQRAQAVATEYVRYRNSTTAQYGIAASLVTPAGPAEEQRRPLWLYLTAGAVAGLLLGVLSALWHARRRDRLRGRAHYEEQTGLPVLATIPRARRSRGPGAPLPVLLRSPDSADAEAYRYLRARLDPLLHHPATVLVAGGRDGEGRSTTAANLAVALAQAGRRVVLVDTDVRHPALHLMFDLSRDRGLTNVLTGRHTLAETLAAGAIVNLRVLAVGAGHDNAADLLAAGGLAGLLHELAEQCDVVVLDSPPLLGVADGLALATQADHVLLVTDYRRTSRGVAARVAADLEQVAPGRVSAVLIDVPDREGGTLPRSRAARAPAPPTVAPPPAPTPSATPARPAAAPPPAPAPPPSPAPSAAPARPSAGPPPAPTTPPSPAPPAPSAAPASTAAPASSAAPAPSPASDPSAAQAPSAAPPQPAAPARPSVADRFAVLDGPGDQLQPLQLPSRAEAAPKPPAKDQPEPRPRSKPVSAKAAIPKPRVYTSAAKAEAEAKVQAEVQAKVQTKVQAEAEAEDAPAEK
ncbi:polysaccharide biosynthesis tyrosine autokinase [Paractinoplanes maris]|uniref:polysaccharide biosynthesis tyrosine autokinase n=1 Tax=Paractinoplanes maris TaxID=1734446 RepID=UPI0020206050|nr:CpsD/CapB family tyrosine-protein kinase [Actinoplanes maris]